MILWRGIARRYRGLSARLLVVAATAAAGCTTPNPAYDPGAAGDGAITRPLDRGSEPAREQPSIRLPITCAPASTRLSREECARASLVLHTAVEPPACDLRPGEPRSALPVLTFIRQDEACAGDRILELTYYAQANESWRLLETSLGHIDPDGQRLRDLAPGPATELRLQTASAPQQTYALTFVLDAATVSVVKLEQLR